MLRVFECFAGYGSQSLALERLGIDFSIVGYCEIDKYAIKAYEALHGDSHINFGDVTKLDANMLPDMDFFTYSFPCQDISIAGKQLGFSKESNTRSSLLWECHKIIAVKRPKYLMMENVKNLVGKKNKTDFEAWINELDALGYNNYWKVINAKDCGIPQNRERVFCVSIRKDIDNGSFKFNEPFDSGIRLKDLLEDEVDEKYYISSEKVEKLLGQLDYENIDKVCCDMTINQPKFRDIGNCIKARYDAGISNQRSEGIGVVVPCLTPDRVKKRQNGRRFKTNGEPMFTLTGQDQHGVLLIDDTQGFDGVRTYDNESPCLRNQRNGLKIVEKMPTHNKQPRVLSANKCNKIGNLGYYKFETMDRVYGVDGIAPTIQTLQGGSREPKILSIKPLDRNRSGISARYRVRKLTPRECFRLMGLTDYEIDLIQAAGISNTQQYKMAGNSIVVDQMLFLKNLFD